MGILDSLTKNPGLLALGALAIGLFIFRDKISGFFSDITGGAQGTAQIAETGGILARNFQSNLTATPLPGDPLFGESGFFTNIAESISNFQFPSLPSFEFPTFELPSFPSIFGEQPATEPTDFTDVGMAAARARQQPTTPEIITQDFGVTAAPSIAETIIAPFTGGGVSFEGGTIFETPIENLSLSQIIDKFMVTASQAADIKAQAIGFTPQEESFLNQPSTVFDPITGNALAGGQITDPAVSDPQFQGLTPEQIFLQLVGGNISNF